MIPQNETTTTSPPPISREYRPSSLEATPNRATIPRWAVPFLKPARYKSAAGGRGSSKSHTFAQIMVLRMAGLLPEYDDPDGVRICSARQFQEAIRESVKQVIEHYIKKLGLQGHFNVRNYFIDARNGSHMWFPGFNRNPDSLLGAEGIDILWIEQAESLGEEMGLIAPTIRKPGSELWFSWNPRKRLQWCWKRFYEQREPDDVVAHVNFNDNPWFPLELERERLRDKKWEPEIYEHRWLGQPDDDDGESTILPYKLLQACTEAYRRGLYPKIDDGLVCDAGFDVAEGGKNKCAVVIRRGPIVDFVRAFPGKSGDLSHAAKIAHECTEGYYVYKMYYDGSSPMKREFRDLNVQYGVEAINFGGAVDGPDVEYEYLRKNKDVFAHQNMQMAQNVRMRAQQTVRLLQGDKSIDPYNCLFINPNIPQLEIFLNECTGPIRRLTPQTGKWEIDKRGGDENAESPDRFDALCLAFKRDSQDGLVAR